MHLRDFPREYSSRVFSRDPTKFSACSAMHYYDPGQFATSQLFNYEWRFRRTNSSPKKSFLIMSDVHPTKSDKDSIVNSAVIYLCIQSLYIVERRTARAIMFIIAMWCNSVYLPYQTTGNLSIAFLSKCPINNNLITLRLFPLILSGESD